MIKISVSTLMLFLGAGCSGNASGPYLVPATDAGRGPSGETADGGADVAPGTLAGASNDGGTLGDPLDPTRDAGSSSGSALDNATFQAAPPGLALDLCALYGNCGCEDDGAEPNERRSASEAELLTTMRDHPNSDVIFSGYRISSGDDVDWFRIPINDKGPEVPGNPINPRMTVLLSGVPAGDDYELAAYFACDQGTNVSDCEAGNEDVLGDNLRGCTSDHAGNASETVQIKARCQRAPDQQEGTLWVQVRSHQFSQTCENYSLRVSVI